MSYWFNEKEIEKKLNKLRSYLKEKALDWKTEGEVLEQIETLKKDLTYAKLFNKAQTSRNYSSHALEMKIKFGK